MNALASPVAADVEIRTARGAEIAACRLLLAGDHPPQGRGEQFLAAIQQDGPRLVGAACFVGARDGIQGIRLRVVKPCRRRSIGTRLLNAVLEAAQGPRTRRAYLVAWRGPEEETAEPFLGRHGFELSSTIVRVEAPLASLAGYFRDLSERLRRHARIPADARVIPLGEASRDEVLRLIAHQLQEREEPGATVSVIVNHARYNECPVVVIGDRVAGVLLWEVTGQIADVPVRVVAERQQGSWVNVLLLEHATRQGFERNIERIRFEIPQGNSDTEKLASRYGAQVISIQERYEREIS